jgi:hypothetical protein
MIQGYITVAMAVERYDFSAIWLRTLCRKGKITAEKVGNAWLIEEASLTDYQKRMADLGLRRFAPHREQDADDSAGN